MCSVLFSVLKSMMNDSEIDHIYGLFLQLGSETWLHDVFACPLHRDVCVSVTEFARTTDLVQSDIRVPGSSAHADALPAAPAQAVVRGYVATPTSRLHPARELQLRELLGVSPEAAAAGPEEERSRPAQES